MFALELITFGCTAILCIGLLISFCLACANYSRSDNELIILAGLALAVAMMIMEPIIFQHFDDTRAKLNKIQTHSTEQTCQDKGGQYIHDLCVKKGSVIK